MSFGDLPVVLTAKSTNLNGCLLVQVLQFSSEPLIPGFSAGLPASPRFGSAETAGSTGLANSVNRPPFAALPCDCVRGIGARLPVTGPNRSELRVYPKCLRRIAAALGRRAGARQTLPTKPPEQKVPFAVNSKFAGFVVDFFPKPFFSSKIWG